MRGVLVANSTSSSPGPLNEWRRKAKLSIQSNDSRHARSCNDCPNKPEENQTKYTTTEKTSRAVNANIDSDASSILLNHEHFGTQFYSCHEVNTLFVLFVTLFSPSFFFSRHFNAASVLLGSADGTATATGGRQLGRAKSSDLVSGYGDTNGGQELSRALQGSGGVDGCH